mmetsp:Transcript_53860/g.128761  ORF Transcript_53860/g.128761 Transcript_53860/m.128761 type:complete len:343 (+) Transcript_53860:458-1486(+)
MESYMYLGLESPMVRLSRVNSEVGLGKPRTEPGRCGRFSLSSMMGAILHSSSSWSQTARSWVFWISFMGTKDSMIRDLSFSVCRSSRIMESMSSRSCWLKCWRSTISCCAFWYLSQSFCSFVVSFWTCSSWEAHRSSSCMFSWRCCSSWRRSSSSLSCCFFSRLCCFLSSCSCLMACSITCLPWTIFISICCSLPCSSSLCCSSCIEMFSCSSIWARSRNLSDSARSRWASTSRRRASAFIWASWICWRCCSSMAATSSGLGPCSTITSFSTVLSTIFSTYSTCFSTRTPPGPMGTPFSSTISPPDASSSALSLIISSWYSRIMASFGSSLIRGLFLMFLAR